MPETSFTPRNRLLAGLPDEARARLAAQLEPIALEARQLLFDVDRPIAHVYFPESLVGSVVGVMADGSAVETATVGLEGMIGLPVFFGTDQTSAQAFVQVPGTALRMTADAFRDAVATLPSLARALQRYAQAVFTLVAQSAGCNRLHHRRLRCARWLLHTHDRVGRDEFPLAEQFLAQMVGEDRATALEAVSALVAAGAVSYTGEQVLVRGRALLEAHSCECYAIIVREFDRLLAPPGVAGLVRSPLEHLRTAADGLSVLRDGTPPREP